MKVLVVDDDATARILLRAALRQADFEVGLAVCGEDALRRFRDQAWDLVMLDVQMPDLSGHEVCAAMRAQAGELLPIVMVTGMEDVDSVQQAYDSGATDFIAKPVNHALIAHRVKYLMRAHRAMLDLQSANARNAAILQALPDPLFEIDIDGRIVDSHVPETGGALVSMPRQWVDKTIAEALPPQAAQVCMAALVEADATGRSTGQQFELKLANGSFWSELSVSRKAVGAGQKPHFIVLSRDITERKEAERRMQRLAHFDSLTGLPNRRAFLERVIREIKGAEREPCRLAVLFMDLDGFKNINDTLGHAAGDHLLQSVADRLRESVRPSDMVSRASAETADGIELARLGGDEFTALVLDLKRPDDALAVARRIIELMQRPFILQEREVSLSSSIGIALFPDDGMDALSLLEHADAAMYHAKESGRGQCAFYRAGAVERAA
jgi:diguanylate cyclase (GGDEF)-like protein